MSNILFRIVGIVVAVLFIVGTASARLKQVVDLGGCGEGAPCKHTAAYYDDDCTNDRFVIYTYCVAPAAPFIECPHIDPSEVHGDPDWRIATDIFSRYINARYGVGMPMNEQIEENTHEDLGVMGMIDATHSNLMIRQMPSPGNGMKLIVVPIAREIASAITVTRADGTLVWSGGDTMEPSVIDLAGQPSGIYFVRGMGKSLVVQVVR